MTSRICFFFPAEDGIQYAQQSRGLGDLYTGQAKPRPIVRFDVRSFLTDPAQGAHVPADTPLALRGIAFDGGSGIRRVEVSTDDGKSWTDARLGEDLGRYSFRPWSLSARLPRGTHIVRVRATANSGEQQPMEPRWNPAGYMRNVVETVAMEAV